MINLGAGSLLTSDELIVGNTFAGQVNMQPGSLIAPQTRFSDITIGNEARGEVNVGQDARIDMEDYEIVVGRNAEGSLNLSPNSEISGDLGEIKIGFETGSTGTVRGDQTLIDLQRITVGFLGGTGKLELTDSVLKLDNRLSISPAGSARLSGTTIDLGGERLDNFGGELLIDNESTGSISDLQVIRGGRATIENSNLEIRDATFSDNAQVTISDGTVVTGAGNWDIGESAVLQVINGASICLLYTSPSPRDRG